MAETVKNPYSKDSQEAKFLTWEHGYNSPKQDDNPYDKADEPELYQVWNKAFRANKSRPKAALEPIDEEGLPVQAEVAPATLSGVSTELLELELKKRKLKELTSLNQQASQLEKQLNEVKLKIDRLNVLLGD